MPGLRSMIRYCPVPSVTADRVFSIRTGLETSTVTPGRTAPDASRMVPVSDPCANTGAASSRTPRTNRPFVAIRIRSAPFQTASEHYARKYWSVKVYRAARMDLLGAGQNVGSRLTVRPTVPPRATVSPIRARDVAIVRTAVGAHRRLRDLHRTQHARPPVAGRRRAGPARRIPPEQHTVRSVAVGVLRRFHGRRAARGTVDRSRGPGAR